MSERSLINVTLDICKLLEDISKEDHSEFILIDIKCQNHEAIRQGYKLRKRFKFSK
ncbi:hypothetical protein SAMN06265218_12013 [Fodinibius sediminis]|uniref:Uncharacterized protein n=1 Tax=Fodinibius sediminis TaxID=1214077 RepID=A0A521EXN5_9BACT|nr:hypothetical protein SAMN06265218_12013 [Fodinibius sediminis]